MPSSRPSLLMALALAAWMAAPAVAFAQAPARPPATPAATPTPPPDARPIASDPDVIPDYREEMRGLIQKLAAYARSLKPDFAIVVQNGLELTQKVDEIDPRVKAPARAYLRAIDGVLVAPLHFGKAALDAPLEDDETKSLLEYTELARRNGLRVLAMDFGDKPATADAAHQKARKLGYAAFTANGRAADIAALPRHPRRPYDENPNSVVSLSAVRNFLYLRDSQGFGRQDEFVLKIHDQNYDLVVVDVYHGRTPLARPAVETLKYKKLGARRLALAYVNVGQAASYHYYWKPGWREGSPGWITAPVAGNPDSYHVRYWEPEWQSILYGNPNSYLYGVSAQGFDGVVLDGADTFRFFEGD